MFYYQNNTNLFKKKIAIKTVNCKKLFRIFSESQQNTQNSVNNFRELLFDYKKQTPQSRKR